MALSAPPGFPDAAEVERRHFQWIEFLHEERKELAALSAAKRTIEVESEAGWEYLISYLKQLTEKSEAALTKTEEEYNKRRSEREALFEQSVGDPTIPSYLLILTLENSYNCSWLCYQLFPILQPLERHQSRFKFKPQSHLSSLPPNMLLQY